MGNLPRDPFFDQFTDPVERLLLSGDASSIDEAEEMVPSYEEVLRLLQSPLSNEALGRHPLMVLYRTRGSRPSEDDLL